MGEGEAIPPAASSFSQFPSSHHSVRPISSPALRGPVRHSRSTQLRMVKQVMLPTQKEIRCTLQKSIAGQAFGILLLLMLLLVILLLVLYPPLPHSPPTSQLTPLLDGLLLVLLLSLLVLLLYLRPLWLLLPSLLVVFLQYFFSFSPSFLVPSPGVRPHRYSMSKTRQMDCVCHA